MSNYLQIDPESLAIHINASILNGTAYSSTYFRLLDQCALGHFDDAKDIVTALTNEEHKILAVEFLSRYVHEFRHHVDLLLTSYGWYRLRMNMEVMMNMPYLALAKEFKQITVPLSLAANPLDLDFLGTSEAEVKGLARFAIPVDSRRAVVARDNEPIQYGPYWIQIGGESVLEALAYFTQRSWIGMNFTDYFHNKHFDYLIRPEMSDALNTKYNWPAFVFNAVADETRHDISENMREAFVAGLLFISLVGSALPSRPRDRNYKDIPAHTTSRDISNALPSERIAALMGALEQDSFRIHTSQELFDTLIRISKETFGKSFIEELHEDLLLNEQFAGEMCTQIESFPHSGFAGIGAVYRSFLEKRRELYQRFVENPLEFIVPHLFSPQLTQSWAPHLIYFFVQGLPDGAQLDLTQIKAKWIGLHHQTIKLPDYKQSLQPQQLTYSLWLRPDEIRQEISDGYIYFYGYLVPVAKVLLHGYRYNAMSEVELVHGRELLQSERKLVFDPEFERAQRTRRSSSFFSIIGRQNGFCDKCGSPIDETCLLVSPLTARQNQDFWQNIKTDFQQHLPGATPDIVEGLFNGTHGIDWSEWALCGECVTRFNFEEQSEILT